MEKSLQATLSNKELFITAAGLKAAAVVGEHLYNNKDYYADVFKYTFCRSHAPIKRSKVYFSDLPSKIVKKLTKIHKDRFKNKSIEKIFQKLNIQRTARNMFSPLQGKFQYEYYKKFGTSKYSSKNSISEKELLRKLSDVEAAEYLKMFS